MNAKGGYYSEPEREQRRRERRVENLLERKAAGKSTTENLNELTTGGSKPGTIQLWFGKLVHLVVVRVLFAQLCINYRIARLEKSNEDGILSKETFNRYTQEGYHWLFKPFVKAMKKSKIVEALGAHVAKHRTQELKHSVGLNQTNLVKFTI